MGFSPFVDPPTTLSNYEMLQRTVQYMQLDLELELRGCRFIDVIDFYVLGQYCKDRHSSPKDALIAVYFSHPSTKLMLSPPSRGELNQRVGRISRRLEAVNKAALDKLAKSDGGKAFLRTYHKSNQGQAMREELNRVFKDMWKAHPDAVEDLYFVATFRKHHLEPASKMLEIIQSEHFVSNSEVLRQVGASSFSHEGPDYTRILSQLNSRRQGKEQANEVDARCFGLTNQLNATARSGPAAREGKKNFFRFVTDKLVAEVVTEVQGGWIRSRGDDAKFPSGRPLGAVSALHYIAKYRGLARGDEHTKRAFLDELATRIKDFMPLMRRPKLSAQDHKRFMRLRDEIQRESYLEIRKHFLAEAPLTPFGLNDEEPEDEDGFGVELAEMHKIVRIGEALADVERRGGQVVVAERTEYATQYQAIMTQLANILEHKASPSQNQEVDDWRTAITRILNSGFKGDSLENLIREIRKLRDGWKPTPNEMKALVERAAGTVRGLIRNSDSQDEFEDTLDMCIRLKEDFKVADRLLEAQNIKELIDAMRLALGNKGELVDAAG